jgi:membrane protease YdiL (CAAX protease family)
MGSYLSRVADFSQNWLSLFSFALALAIVAICLRIYQRLLTRVLAGRGKVSTDRLGLPDLLMSLVLMTWLGNTAARGFVKTSPTPPLTDSSIIASSALFVIIVIAVTLFLRARQIAVGRLFGLHSSRPFFIVKTGLSLILAALPLVFAASTLVQWIAGEELEPQEVVRYFSHAAEHAQWGRVILAAVFGVIVAPATEEFLFRGYFYGVLRRYLGVLPALILISALFASIHLSLPSFLPLFLLAGCLTLAYEATGSLWTPILMHACFNAIMLGAMYFKAAHP